MRIKKQPRIIIIRKQLILGFLILLFGTSLFRVTGVYEDYRWQKAVNEPGLEGKTVIIDPGHGGADPGAISDGLHEAEINMALAESLKKLLEQMGVKVKLTRNKNQGLVAKDIMSYAEQWAILEERKKFAREEHGHFLLSIHGNSHKDKTASGAIVFYADEKSKDLAQKIQEKLSSLGSRERKSEMRNFTIIDGNKIPSVLIEAGFITNTQDREILTKETDLVAAKILEGLDQYAQNMGSAE